MKLDTAERIYHESVTEDQLVEAFEDDEARGEYIILNSNSEEFIQAAGMNEGPYILEYKEAGIQYRSSREFTKEEVQDVFLRYLNGDSSWKAKESWNQMEIKPWWKFW